MTCHIHTLRTKERSITRKNICMYKIYYTLERFRKKVYTDSEKSNTSQFACAANYSVCAYLKEKRLAQINSETYDQSISRCNI